MKVRVLELKAQQRDDVRANPRLGVRRSGLARRIELGLQRRKEMPRGSEQQTRAMFEVLADQRAVDASVLGDAQQCHVPWREVAEQLADLPHDHVGADAFAPLPKRAPRFAARVLFPL